MRIIIDNNIVFSIMKPDSVSSLLFYNMLEKYEFFAPSYLIEEFNNNEKECFAKSKTSIDDFKLRKKEVFSRIKFIELDYYKEEVKKLINLISDKDDIVYLALALKMDCTLWSNDSLLKNQNKVRVLSTEDLIEILF
ncbi:MAG: PIN domain-containing protein [Nanoarchaeota archaeon]